MIRKLSTFVIAITLATFCFGFKGCSEKEKQDFEKNARVAVRIAAAGAGEVREELRSYCRAEQKAPESCEKALPHADRIAEIAGRVDRFMKDHPKLTSEGRDEILSLAVD